MIVAAVAVAALVSVVVVSSSIFSTKQHYIQINTALERNTLMMKVIEEVIQIPTMARIGDRRQQWWSPVIDLQIQQHGASSISKMNCFSLFRENDEQLLRKQKAGNNYIRWSCLTSEAGHHSSEDYGKICDNNTSPT